MTFDMANRPRGLLYERNVSLSVSRHTFTRPDQIFRVGGFGRSTSNSSRRYSSPIKVNSVNPILSPPTIRSFAFTQTPRAEAESAVTPMMQSVSAVGNFPSPLPGLGSGAFGLGSAVSSRLKMSSSLKKMLLSAVPGFFGLMGLGQLYEKRRKTGSFFFGAGALLSIFSSWYTILPERIFSFVSGGAALPPYALTWMSRFTGYNSSLGELSIVLLAFIPALWALQLYDSVSPIMIAVQAAARPLSAAPAIPKALPIATKSNGVKSREEAEESVKKLANDLMKTKSLFSYLWER